MSRRRARAPPRWRTVNATKAAHKVLWVLVTMPAERARIFGGIFAQIFPSCAPEPRNALQMVPKGPKFSGATRRKTHHQISPRLLNKVWTNSPVLPPGAPRQEGAHNPR
eukprot:scaffold56599_cov45-Phaeocystis_antarctica.AAC.1